jgi:hypothetical protein
MKQIIFIAVACFTLAGRAQQFQWMKTNHYSGNCQNYSNLGIDHFGNLIVAGMSADENAWIGVRAFIEKYNPAGNLLWADTTDFFFATFGSSGVAVDASDNIYTAFNVQGDTGVYIHNQWYPGWQTYLLKYSSTGQLIWVQSLDYMIVSSMATDAQGLIYVSGAYGTMVFNNAGNLVKQFPHGAASIYVDPQANLLTPAKKISPAGTQLCSIQSEDYGSISGDGSGNAFAISWNEFGNATLLKVNANCQTLWTKQFPHTSATIHYANNSIYTAGYQNGLVVKKYDLQGNMIWSYFQADPNIGQFQPASISTHSNAVYISGGTWQQDEIGFLLRLRDTTYNAPIVSGIEEAIQYAPLEIYPMPSNDCLNLRLVNGEKIRSYTLIDLSGQAVLTNTFIEGETNHHIQIPLDAINPGMYSIEVWTSAGIVRSKIVKAED